MNRSQLSSLTHPSVSLSVQEPGVGGPLEEPHALLWMGEGMHVLRDTWHVSTDEWVPLLSRSALILRV